MADTNPFPRTVASITREGRGPQTHACNVPNLSPKEFLLAVMHDPTQPLSIRIKAARDVAPYIAAAPAPVPPITCRIILTSLDEFILGSGQGPTPLKKEFSTKDPEKEFVAEDPEQINGKSQSKSAARLYNHHPLTLREAQIVIESWRRHYKRASQHPSVYVIEENRLC